MRGSYYVVTALLVTTTSQIAGEANQTGPPQSLDNDFVASSGTVDETMPLRESRDPQDDLALYEERAPSAPRTSLGAFEQTMLNSFNLDEKNVVATAAKLIEDQREWMPMLKGKSSKSRKHQRIYPTSNDGNGQVLPHPQESFVSVANTLPLVLAKRLDRGDPIVNIENAARSRTQHDYRSSPLGPSTTTVTAPEGRLTNKAFEFDLNKIPDEVEIRNSKRQRIGLVPFIKDGQVLYALPNLEEAPVWVASNVPSVLADRMKKKPPTIIMNNAGEAIKKHDFRPATSRPSTSRPDGQIRNQLASQKALEFGTNKYFDEENHIVEHHLQLREKNDIPAHPATISGQSVPIDWTADILRGPIVPINGQVTKKVEKIHTAFLEAFSVPFHQYPQETAKMISIIEWTTDASPSNGHLFRTFKSLANKQSLERLKRLLEPDLHKLLGNGMAVLHNHKISLEEAYIVKLLIMYELLYDFCHSRLDLLNDLPRKINRSNWILQLSTSNTGSSDHPILIPHD